MQPYDPSELFNLVDITGVVANALLGGAVARAHRFDLVGFIIIGMCSGLGGGVMRDLLLGVGYPVALTHSAYLPAVIIASFAAYLLVLGGTWSRRLLMVADFLALGCWAATGTLKAYSMGLAWLPALLMGVLTATGGGIIRDVLVARVPAVFGGGPLYATVAVVGSVEMLVCAQQSRPELGMGLSIATCALLGLLARWRGWTLPSAAQWTLRPVRVPALPTLPPLPSWQAAAGTLPSWLRRSTTTNRGDTADAVRSSSPPPQEEP